VDCAPVWPLTEPVWLLVEGCVPALWLPLTPAWFDCGSVLLVLLETEPVLDCDDVPTLALPEVLLWLEGTCELPVWLETPALVLVWFALLCAPASPACGRAEPVLEVVSFGTDVLDDEEPIVMLFTMVCPGAADFAICSARSLSCSEFTVPVRVIWLLLPTSTLMLFAVEESCCCSACCT
jgi:hypothetical protein